jgi:tetratricopeptide (TPR) repeat protein
MDLEYWINVNLACGQVYNLLGEREEAKESYEEALSQINSEPGRPSVRKLAARVFQGMGELLEPTAPQEALNWLHRGLEVAAGGDALAQAAMNLTIGNVQMNMGNYEAALAALEQGFADLPETATQLRCNGLMNFGGVYFFLGDIERAKEYTLRALEISQQMHDHFRTVDLLSNLGAYRFTACEWQEAIEDWQRALSLAEQLGSEIQKCSSEANLGMAYIYTGDDEAALNHLNNALSLIQKNNLPYFESNVQHCLADLRIRSEDWQGAVSPLRDAERLALEIDARGELPQIYGAWAEVMLGTGRPQEALERSKQATELAQELGMTLEEGKCRRILAQSLLTNNQIIEAMKGFERSLALLQSEDPYEAARTKMFWGLALLAESNSQAGNPLLKEARDTFQTLGAKRDLAYIKHHWPHHNP